MRCIVLLAARALPSPQQRIPACCGEQYIFFKEGEGQCGALCCSRRVRCPHLNSEPLAEQRLACCSSKASGDPHAAGSIIFFLKRGEGQCGALCCSRRVRCPHLNSEPLAEQRLACCSSKASGDPHPAGSIIFF